MNEQIITAFREFAEGKGIDLPSELKADGTVHRFPIGDNSGNKNGAYVLHVNGSPNGWVQDWRDNKHDWTPVKGSFPGVTVPDQATVRAQIQNRADEAAGKQAKAAIEAQKQWNNAKIPDEMDSHPYLTRKGLRSFHDARLSGDSLIIPIVNADGEIVSMQFIDRDGNKRLLKDGKKQGNYSILNQIEPSDIQAIVIGEGFATIASIIEDDYCSGEDDTAGTVPGVMAIDAGNLKPVAISIGEQYPDTKIIIAADNDDKGLKEAKRAAESVGAFVAFPPIESMDFNDYLTQPKDKQPQSLAQLFDGGLLINQEGHQEESLSGSWKDKLLAHVEHFNKEYAQVIIGGKHRVMREDRHTGAISFLDQKDFERAHQHRVIQISCKANGDPKYDTLAKSWLNNYFCRTFSRGVISDPALPSGDCGNEQFNLWRGFTIAPKENHGLTAVIRHHIENIICDGKQPLVDYFYNWVAYTVQHPDRPAGSALVCRGEKGSGKGTIGSFLKNLWGNHSLHITSPKHLTGNFNAHLANVCFLFADEAFYSNDKPGEGVLKALITESNLMIERKGLDAEQQPNRLKIFMATNSDYAVPASRDERRYCVFDVSSEKMGDRGYFNALHKDCENKDVQAAFLFDMVNRDISDFHTGDIPESEGLQDQRMNSLNTIGKWLVDSFGQGFFAYPDNQVDGSTIEVIGWVYATRIYESYLSWCDSMKINQYGRETHTAFGRYLTNVGYARRHSNGTQRDFGSLAQAIEKLERYEKINIEHKQVKPVLAEAA